MNTLFLTLIFSLLFSSLAIAQQISERVELYLLEAEQYIQKKEYAEACRLIDTSIKMIEGYKLENSIDSLKIRSQKEKVCSLATQESKRRWEEAQAQLKSLNSLMESNPALMDQLMKGGGLNCTHVRQKCKNTKDYYQCIHYFNLNNPVQGLNNQVACPP